MKKIKNNFVDLTPLEHFVLLGIFNNFDMSSFSIELESLLKKKYILKATEGKYKTSQKGEAFCFDKSKAKIDFKKLVLSNNPKENLVLSNTIAFHNYKILQSLDDTKIEENSN